MQTVQHESKQIVIQLGQSQHDFKTCNLEAIITVKEMKLFAGSVKDGSQRDEGGDEPKFSTRRKTRCKMEAEVRKCYYGDQPNVV